MGRILVTGAAGFIGSHLTDRLLALGHEVVGVDALTRNYARECKLENLRGAMRSGGFRFVEGDLLRLDLGGLLDGIDAVAHLAGETGVRASWGPGFAVYLDRNVRATERLLEAAVVRGVGRFVHASSSSVYGSDSGRPASEATRRRPASPYGVSKLAAEELVGLYRRERGLSGSVVLRYFTVYGPRQRPEMAFSRFLAAAVEECEVEVYGDGEQVRELTYVSDVAEATVAALEGGGPSPVYNVGSGTRATVNEMIESVRVATGTEVRAVYRPAAPGDARSTWADSGLARRELGYEPRVGLEEGVRTQAEWVLGASLAPSPA